MTNEIVGNVLPLVSGDHPILTQPIPEFDFEAESAYNPIQLAYDLVASMRAHRGLGLSANQVSVGVRAFAIEAKPAIVCFNPIIVDFSTTQVLLEEGCLSFPGIFVKIRRPRLIKVRYTEPNGNRVTKSFDGMTARIFQHELDHLDGICHITRAHPMHREVAMRKFEKYKRRKKHDRQ